MSGKVRGLAACTVLLFGLASCSQAPSEEEGQTRTSVGFASCPKAPDTCNTGDRRQGGQVIFALEQEWTNWNMNSAEGNLVYTAQALAPLQPGVFITTPKPDSVLNTDLMQSAELTDPTTIVYKIKPEAVWDDGTPVSGKDFEFMWRAHNNKDCSADACQPFTNAGYDRISDLEITDGGKTVTAKLSEPYVDWKGLFVPPRMYPAHIAEKEVGPLDNEANLAKAMEYFGETVPTWSAGPYKLQSYKQGDSLVYVKNPKWYGASKPTLDRLIFKIITDVPQLPTALANREVNAIAPQPQVDMIQQLKQDQNSNYYVGPGLGWEHFDINTENEFLKDKALRQAIFTAVNRQAMLDKTVNQFTSGIKPLNNFNLYPGVSDHYKDVITPTGAGNGNTAAAKKVLADAGYTVEGGKLMTPSGEEVPPLRTRYTAGNEIRKVIVEQLAEMVRPLGVTIKIQTTDDLAGTLGKKDFDIMLFGWTGSLFTFANAQQWWSSGSSSNYSGYGTEEIDNLLNDSLGEVDEAKASDLLNQALGKFAEGYAVLPIYVKPTTIATNKDVVNVRNNPTGQSPTYNTQDWGLLAQ